MWQIRYVKKMPMCARNRGKAVVGRSIAAFQRALRKRNPCGNRTRPHPRLSDTLAE